MPPKRFFDNDNVIAVISDASIDFTPTDFDNPLSAAQQQYLKKAIGIDIPQVFWRKQIHGDDILNVKGSVATTRGCPDADAYVTNEQNLPIAIRTADCVPVFIYDSRKRTIGLAHAGWKGTHKEIASKTVQRMQEQYQSDPQDLKVAIGPSIRPCCYQVGPEFKDYFPSYISERDGHLYVDIAKANIDQLLKAGVKKENILDSGICTCCDKNYFSFRRDGAKSGRMISLMMLYEN